MPDDANARTAPGEDQLRERIHKLEQEVAAAREVQRALAQSEERFALAVQGASDGLWDWVVGTDKVYYAPRFKELLGYADDEMANRFEEFETRLHPDDHDRIMDAVQAHVAGTAPYDVEYRLRCKDGAYRWFRARGRAIRDASGHAMRMAGSITDITEQKAMVRELAKSEERFALAVDGASDGIWDWDLRTNEVYFSTRWKAMLGYESHEVANNFAAFEELLHPDDRAPILAAVRDYLGGRTDRYAVEFRFRHKDGSYRWILARGKALRDPEGRPYRMAGSHTDITAHKEALRALAESEERLRLSAEDLREREEQLRAIVTNLVDGIITIDSSGVVHSFNPAAGKIFGYAAGEIVGKNVSLLMPEPDRSRHDGYLARYLETGEAKVIGRRREAIGQRKDGSTFPMDLAIGEMVLGDKRMFVGIARDISARKVAEEHLRQARLAAEEANRAKSEFLANMSHEIRTPMNGIIGMAELLLNTHLSPVQRSYLGMVKSSADSLLALLNDILDFSKIEAGRLELDHHPFNLRDAIGDMMQALGLRATEKQIELAYQVQPNVPDHLAGDMGRLRQILVNLVGNAIKFTQQGEVVLDVRLEIQTRNQVSLHFVVTDTGIGISDAKHRKIFEAFTQAESSTTRRYGGTGLGLTISRQLVELMKGRIWLESEPGHGSTFHFTALFDLRADPGGTSRLVPETLRGLRVLVVDDNRTNRLILEEMLRHWDMAPAVAASGSEALQQMDAASAAGSAFQLVLLDVMMPGVDGFEVARHIRDRFGGDAPKVILLSSAGLPLAPVDAANPCIASSLTKPVKQADVLDAITQVLGAATRDEERSGAAIPARPATQWPMKVLLAEDGRTNQVVATSLLEERGHLVTLASNGREAVAAFERERFDAVLMDIQMPEVNGFEATAKIREMERSAGSHTPIIAMTANALKGDRERCLEAGMDDYIAKPLHSSELYAVVEKYAPPAGGAAVPAAPAKVPAEDGISCEIFDADAFRASIGDPGLMRRVVDISLHETSDLLERAATALANDDAAALHNAAHTLKGVFGAFSAHPAFHVAMELDTLARGGDLPGAAAVFPAVRHETERLSLALLDFRRGLGD